MEGGRYDIKDAARYVGVASSTLRFWESRGLVRAGRDGRNGYRRYDLHDLIEASEVAFYRKLEVPVKELEGYRSLSIRELDEALARTEDAVEGRIADLAAIRARLAHQRSLNACADELRHSPPRPRPVAIAQLSAIDYKAAQPWQLLVDEPWRYGVYVSADKPETVREGLVDAPGAAEILWQDGEEDQGQTSWECLFKLALSPPASNAGALFRRLARQGLKPQALVGSYLLTAYEDHRRWDWYRAWVLAKNAPPPSGRREDDAETKGA